MDPWQQSVEKRLDSLDRRLGAVETSVTDIKVEVGKLSVGISHLPSKSFIVTALLGGLTALSLIVGIIANWSRIFPPA